jgi:hypothetical protein
MRFLVLFTCLAACETTTVDPRSFPDNGKADRPGQIQAAPEIRYGQTSPKLSFDGKNPIEVPFKGQDGDAVHIRVQSSAAAPVALVDYYHGNVWFPEIGTDVSLDFTLDYRGYFNVLFQTADGSPATFTVRVDGPACNPTMSCASVGAACGAIDDGCETISCGGCPAGQGCGIGGVKNQCAALPPPDPGPAFPATCVGKQMTSVDMVHRLASGGSVATGIGGYSLLESYRDCNGAGCGSWSQPAVDLQGGLDLVPIGDHDAQLRLTTDFCGQQFYSDCQTSTYGISFQLLRVLDFDTGATGIWPNVTFQGVATEDCMSAEASVKNNGHEIRYFVAGWYY